MLILRGVRWRVIVGGTHWQPMAGAYEFSRAFLGLGPVGALCFLTHFVGGLVGPSCSCSSSLSFPLVKEGDGGYGVLEF